MAIRSEVRVAATLIACVLVLSGPGVRAESVGERCDRLAAGPDDPARRGGGLHAGSDRACPTAAGRPPHEDREQAWTWLLIAGLPGGGKARAAATELANGSPFETLNEARQAADRWVGRRRAAVTD